MFNLLSKIFSATLKILNILTRKKLPMIVAVSVIVFNKNGKLLVQKRADKQGYCIPGGLTTVKESVEDAAYREVEEETGIKIKNLKFLFYVNPGEKHESTLGLIFRADILKDGLKNSWEGEALWEDYTKIHNQMAFNQQQVIDRYLKEFKK